MTSLASWIAVDQRGQSSAYIATDSRISWGDGNYWDSGRKVFACQTRPELLGYVGVVLFPSLVLSQITNAIDAGVVFNAGDTPQDRARRIGDLIEQSFQGIPYVQDRGGFQILYVTRQNEKMESVFHAFSIEWSPDSGWARKSIPMPPTSDTLVIWGSGEQSIRKWKERWDRTREKGTSRAVFSAFCDSILDGADRYSGGAPQLVGVYRIGPGRTFGIVHQNHLHVLGVNIGPRAPEGSLIKWHNRHFERCGTDGKRLPDAMPHTVPHGLGGQ